MSKYTATERTLVKSIVASLSIKRIPETEIMKEVYLQTNKSLSRSGLYRVKQSIKKDSSKWYTALMKSDHEYLHQFKERIDEIIWLQRKHHELIDKFTDTPHAHLIQSSLQELHRLNVTLSNYFDVAPEMKNNKKLAQYGFEYHERMQELASVKAELNELRIRDAEKEKLREREKLSHLSNNLEKVEVSQISAEPSDKEELEEKQELICYCDGSIMNHYECSKCGHVWCPEDKTLALEQQSCPNCSPSQDSLLS
jgi:DNA-directed RNA polymerase subunit RPC12/RpoP